MLLLWKGNVNARKLSPLCQRITRGVETDPKIDMFYVTWWMKVVLYLARLLFFWVKMTPTLIRIIREREKRTQGSAPSVRGRDSRSHQQREKISEFPFQYPVHTLLWWGLLQDMKLARIKGFLKCLKRSEQQNVTVVSESNIFSAKIQTIIW